MTRRPPARGAREQEHVDDVVRGLSIVDLAREYRLGGERRPGGSRSDPDHVNDGVQPELVPAEATEDDGVRG